MVNFHFFLYVSKNVLSRVSCIVCYLWMLLRHVLFGELCQLNQLRYDLLLVVTVGAVNQSASYCV